MMEKAFTQFTSLPKRKKANIFRKAAEIIENQAHLAKYSYKDKEGCACAVGALYEAASGTSLPVYSSSAQDGKFYWFIDTNRMAPEIGTFLQKNEEENPYERSSSLEAFNNNETVDRSRVAKSFRQIARAIEHGGKFGV